MGVPRSCLRQAFLFILWSGFVNGLDSGLTPSALDTDNLYHSNTKIYTCCDLVLGNPQASCSDNLKAENKSDITKEWIFPGTMMAENISTHFPIESRKPKCQTQPVDKIYVPMPGFGQGPHFTKFLKNGYLKVDRHYFANDEYCINAKNSTGWEVYACPQNCTGRRPCIKKCCGLDKVYSFGSNVSISKGCHFPPEGDYFNPVFYDDYKTRSEHSILAPHYIEHYPQEFKLRCPTQKVIPLLFPNAAALFSQHVKFTFNGMKYRVRDDGAIMYKHAKDGKCGFLEFDSHEYCIDGTFNYHPNRNLSYTNDEEEVVLFMCTAATSMNTQAKKVVGMLYGVVMLVSSVFLLMTIATYVALWERQSVHGWTIVSHTVSLFFMYIFLGVSHIIGVNSGHEYLNTPLCIGISIAAHFFFLSTFCWLSLISVDLWLTFRAFGYMSETLTVWINSAFTPRSGQRSKGLGRYIKYSICGWGVPLIIVIVGIVLDKKFPENDCHTLITPAYGRDSCFPQQKSLGVYLYYPIAVMIFLNMMFFAVTTYKLYKYRQSTKMATKDDKQQQFYRLFFKLFFIMGVLWIFEVISWSANGMEKQWYWVLFDMLNVLRALAVFIIFVCKRDIIFALEDNYPCLKPILLPFAWLFKRRHSTHGDNSSMTRTSTLRQTISSDGKESIGLMANLAKG